LPKEPGEECSCHVLLTFLDRRCAPRVQRHVIQTICVPCPISSGRRAIACELTSVEGMPPPPCHLHPLAPRESKQVSLNRPSRRNIRFAIGEFERTDVARKSQVFSYGFPPARGESRVTCHLPPGIGVRHSQREGEAPAEPEAAGDCPKSAAQDGTVPLLMPPSPQAAPSSPTAAAARIAGRPVIAARSAFLSC
jgi:hypothetical protein